MVIEGTNTHLLYRVCDSKIVILTETMISIQDHFCSLEVSNDYMHMAKGLCGVHVFDLLFIYLFLLPLRGLCAPYVCIEE